MEFGPITRALFHNKSRFWLIVVEIALTLALVANCLNMIADHRAKYERPTGIDVANLLVVESQPFAPEFEDEEYVKQSFDQDLATLRALPGVHSASATSAIPLSGGGSMTGRRASGTDVDTRGAPYYVVADDIFQTLGVELLEGRNFVEADFESRNEDEQEIDDDGPDRNDVILTQTMADVLFPDGGALGSTIEDKAGDSIDTIIGIAADMQNSWPNSSIPLRLVFYPGTPASDRRARYLVRTEPGMVDSLYTTLEEELLRVNEGRILEVRTMTEIKGEQYGDLLALNKLLWGVSIMLIAVTSLGIIGLTSFSVTQRTRQIGTRRALGATRLAILRYFLLENWIVTSIGLLLGLGLTYGLNFALTHFAEVPRIGWPLIAGGMIVLSLIGLLAALAPAVRGTLVQPVIATRSV